jgi:hypothetical protein
MHCDELLKGVVCRIALLSVVLYSKLGIAHHQLHIVMLFY